MVLTTEPRYHSQDACPSSPCGAVALTAPFLCACHLRAQDWEQLSSQLPCTSLTSHHCLLHLQKGFNIPISPFSLCAVLVSGTFPEEFILSCWASESSQPGKDPEASHICSEQSNYPWRCHRNRATQKCWESVKARFLRRLSLLLQSQLLPGDGAQVSPRLDPSPLPAAAWQHRLGQGTVAQPLGTRKNRGEKLINTDSVGEKLPEGVMLE